MFSINAFIKNLKEDELKYIPWEIGGVRTSLYFQHHHADISPEYKKVPEGCIPYRLFELKN